MGSSSAWALSKRSDKVSSVTLIEPGYSITSSWGEARITRLAYVDPMMIRLMEMSFQLWDELAKATSTQLLLWTGIIDIVPDDVSEDVTKLKNAYKECKLTYEELPHDEVKRRWPALSCPENTTWIYQKAAALILAQDAVAACKKAAEQNGAALKDDEAVRIDRQRKVVVLQSGTEVPYDKVVLTSGPWTNKLLQASGLDLLPLVPSVEQYLHLEADVAGGADAHTAGNMPILLQHQPKVRPGALDEGGTKISGAYMHPHVPGGVPGCKIGYHRNGDLMRTEDFVVPEITPEQLAVLPHRRQEFCSHFVPDTMDPVNVGLLTRFAQHHTPTMSLTPSSYGRCMYTNHLYPDEVFVVGPHPTDSDIVIATGFGGEGFKFGAVVGELVADVTTGPAARDPKLRDTVQQALHRFRVGR